VISERTIDEVLMHPNACPRCGMILQLGDYPFCGGRNNHGRYGGDHIPDSLPGAGRGEWIENLGPEPTWIESKSQLRREAAARGLRWDPAPQKGKRIPKADDDMRGRYNGGALPTYRELHRPG
jgi:hypothetical protein